VSLQNVDCNPTLSHFSISDLCVFTWKHNSSEDEYTPKSPPGDAFYHDALYTGLRKNCPSPSTGDGGRFCIICCTLDNKIRRVSFNVAIFRTYRGSTTSIRSISSKHPSMVAGKLSQVSFNPGASRRNPGRRLI